MRQQPSSPPLATPVQRLKSTKLTDFFPRRSSDMGSSAPPSSQPLSSQPGSSQPTQTQSSAKLQVKGKTLETKTIPAASFYSQSSSRKGTKGKASQSVAPKPSTTPAADSPAFHDTIAARKGTRLRVSSTPSPVKAAASPAVVASSSRMPSRPRQVRLPSSKRKRDDEPLVELNVAPQSPRKTRTPSRRALPTSPVSLPPPPTTSKRTRSPNKKQRLESPRKSPRKPMDGDADEFVPSSQSDEQEMNVLKPIVLRDRREVQESVESWRMGAAGLSPVAVDIAGFHEEAMDVDDPVDLPVSLGFSSSLSQATSSRASTPEPTTRTPSKYTPSKVPAFRPFTPPSSSPALDFLPEIEDTPAAMPLDAKSKTAQIIAQIRAEAALAVLSPPEENGALKLMELDDSSSDEEVGDWNPFNTSKTGANKKKASDRNDASSSKSSSSTSASRSMRSRPAVTPTLTSPDLESPSRSPGRSASPSPDVHKYNTRTRGSRVTSTPAVGLPSRSGRSLRSTSSPAPSNSSRPVRTRRAPPPRNLSATYAAAKEKKKVNPLEAMLREKKKAERQGGGMDALRRAEGHDVDEILSSIFDGDEDASSGVEGEDFADEAAARRAAGLGVRMRFEGDSVSGDGAGMEDEEVGAEERERLLGEKEGKAVGKILDGDRSAGGAAVQAHRVVGVQVFANAGDAPEAMDVENAVPSWVEDQFAGSGMFEMFRDAVKSKDKTLADLMLDSNLVPIDDLKQAPRVVRWLCEQALWTQDEPAYRFLLRLESPLASPLPLELVAQTLTKLGMQDELLAQLQIDSNSKPSTPRDRQLDREQVVYRMLILLDAFTKLGSTSISELPELMLAVLFCGMDATASPEIKRDVLSTVDLLCTQLPSALAPEAISTSIEAAVAVKVLDYVSTLSVANQVRILSFFARGCPPSLRIARCVAYHLLIDRVLTVDNYVTLPPLAPLIEALGDTTGIFEIADTTEYDALTSRVGVLGVALSGIESYVAEEGVQRRMTQVAALESPRKGKDPVPLELVKNRLDLLHGKIVDTRAAHLDRSRAKAALQRLSLRVYYQRTAMQNSGQRRLKDFWNHGQASGSRA